MDTIVQSVAPLFMTEGRLTLILSKEMIRLTSVNMDQKWRILVEVLGWYGLIVVVIAYGTVSLSFISPNSYVYQFLNLSGAVGLGLVAFVRKAYQNGVLNLVWGTIAIVALLRLTLRT